MIDIAIFAAGLVIGLPLLVAATSCVCSVFLAFATRFDRWVQKRIGAA
jgi:hypothetical protein